MKKILLLAICLSVASCYAPLNNSGFSTNKAWLEIPAKKTNFDGTPYDICYQFNLNLIPASVPAELDLQETCLSKCCWHSEKEEVVLDFNKNFEENLQFYGQAEQYTPAKVTLKVTYSPLLNITAVHVSPRGAVKPDGTLKLKHQTVEDPARLAQLEEQARQDREAYIAQAEHAAQAAARAAANARRQAEKQQRAIELVQLSEASRIDNYFYLIDKDYRQKGYIFLVSRRLYAATPLPDGSYQVTCHAQVQSGKEATQLQNRSLSCGTWKADLTTEKVMPADSVSRQIKAQ